MAANYSKLVTAVTGQTITASERNNEHDNHIANGTPDGIDDASETLVAMQATTDPYPGGSASQPTALRGEIQRLRYLIAQITGKSQWYIDPDTTLAAVVTSLAAKLALAGGTMSGPIAMGSNKITGLAAGTANGDALRYEQLIGLYLLLAGGTMAGNIAMGSNKITGLGAASANGDAVRYEQLKALQYVVGTSVTNFSTTSASFVDTNLTASITPASTASKILILVSGSVQMQTQNVTAYLTIKRGSTDLGGANGMANLFSSTGGNVIVPAHLSYLDSPASASSVTYTVRLASNGTNTAAFPGSSNLTQHITLIELAG